MFYSISYYRYHYQLYTCCLVDCEVKRDCNVPLTNLFYLFLIERKLSIDQGPTRSPSDIDSLSYSKQDSFDKSEPLQVSYAYSQ